MLWFLIVIYLGILIDIFSSNFININIFIKIIALNLIIYLIHIFPVRIIINKSNNIASIKVSGIICWINCSIYFIMAIIFLILNCLLKYNFILLANVCVVLAMASINNIMKLSNKDA